MTTWLWIFGGFYLALLVYASLSSRQKNQSADDFMLAGSNVGVFVGLLTYSATLFSAFTLMGMPDFFRTHGIGAWIFLAVSDGAQIFLIVWFGYRLRQRARTLDFKGTSGLLSALYENRWAGYTFLVGVFLFLVPYVAIQIRGLAIFLEAVFPGALPAWMWSTMIVAIMLLYSEIGGLRAIIFSDVVQGLTLLAVVWIVAIGCLNYFGGVEAMFAEVQATNEALLSVPGPEGLFSLQFLLISFLSVMLLPATQPQLTTRLIVMRSTAKMNRMAVAIGVFMFLILLPVIAIGLYGAVQYSGASTREFLSGVLLFEQANAVAAMAVVGLLAAVMSTADSQIFALGAELRSMLSGEERTVMRITKASMVLFGLAALIFSVFSSDQLVLLSLASFRGTAMLGPLVVTGVFSQQPPGKEVIAATAVGLGLFLASLAGLVPDTLGPLRLDLLLLVLLSAVAGGSVLYQKREAAAAVTQ